MGEPTILGDLRAWVAGLPISIAYRIVWLSARLGSRHGRAVYDAMWEANLSLPLLPNGPRP